MMYISQVLHLLLTLFYGAMAIGALLAATKSFLELAKFVSSQDLLQEELKAGRPRCYIDWRVGYGDLYLGYAWIIDKSPRCRNFASIANFTKEI